MVHRTHFARREDRGGIALLLTLLVIGKDIVGKLVGGRQLAAVDFGQLREVYGIVRLACGKMLVGQVIAQAVRVAHVAAKQRADRIELEAAFIGIREQREELVVFAHFARSFGCCMVIAGDGRVRCQNKRKGGTRSEGVTDEFHGGSPGNCSAAIGQAFA